LPPGIDALFVAATQGTNTALPVAMITDSEILVDLVYELGANANLHQRKQISTQLAAWYYYIYMYTCMYVYTYTYIHICIRTYIYNIYTYIMYVYGANANVHQRKQIWTKLVGW
jgi:hypothetical protein